MTVATILSRKGKNVVSIEPGATLASAAKLLAERRIGAVIVLGAGGRIAGILSERDIVKAVAAHGAAALDHTVGQEMTREVITCVASDPLDSIMERMTIGKFRHVPVVESMRLIGIVSIGDVVKERVAAMESETTAMRDYIQTA